jgi:hypothetical protein
MLDLHLIQYNTNQQLSKKIENITVCNYSHYIIDHII